MPHLQARAPFVVGALFAAAAAVLGATLLRTRDAAEDAPDAEPAPACS
jgi:hypothetical protein